MAKGDDPSSAWAAAAQDGRDEPPAAAPERRQLTILFIDIAGSTALSERLDPEEFIAVLQAYRDICREAIERYGGHIARSFGDGLLAYFGLPHAHEDDAERAVHAALSIVAAIDKRDFGFHSGSVWLDVRLAISTGVVVVGSLPRQAGIDRHEIFGTPAHVAARLQASAPLNTVVIGQPTYDLVRGTFACTDLGAQELKGVREPVRTWRVDEVLRRESRFERRRPDPLTPLVGRAAECRTLLDLWRQSAAGSGQIAVISGEPGIGKSRLIEVLRTALPDARKQTLYFQCSLLHVNTPFAPVIGHLRRAAKLRATDSPAEVIAKLRAMVEPLLPDPSIDVRYRGTILSIPAVGDYTPADLSSPRERDRALEVMNDTTVALARRAPILIIVEDVQWIDPTSFTVLEGLLRRVAGNPILLVATHRDDANIRWPSASNIHFLRLAKLQASECERMANAMTAETPLPRAVLRRIVDRTDGNPLYVEEITRAVLSMWTQRGERPASSGLFEPEVPATIKDSLMERLDGLGDARHVAQVSSIFARSFGLDALASVARESRERLWPMLRKLEADGVLSRVGDPAAATFAFKHTLVREAAYESLLKDERRELHARAAAWLQQSGHIYDGRQLSVLGYHYSRAGITAGAVDALLQAGKSAMSRSAHQEAIANLREALDLAAKLPSSERRAEREIELLSQLAMAYTAMSGWSVPPVDRCYSRALELCRTHGSPRQKSVVLLGMTVAKVVKCQLAQSLAYAQEFIALAESSGDEEIALMAHAAAVIANFYLGNLAEARRSVDFVCARYDPDVHGHLVQTYQHDPKIVALSHAGHVDWLLGYPERARACCAEARRLARQLGDPFMLAYALILGSSDYLYEHDLEANWATVQEGIQIAKEHGQHMFEIFGPLWAVEAAAARQPGKTTLDEHSALVSKLLETRSYLQAPLYQVFLATEFARLGEIGTARELAASAEALMHETGERWFEPEVFRIRAMLLLLGPSPDPFGALKLFECSLASARELKALGWELRTVLSLAQFLREQDDIREAGDLLRRTLKVFPVDQTSADLRAATALMQAIGG